MMDGADTFHLLLPALELADGDKLYVRKVGVDRAHGLFMDVVHGIHELVLHIPGKHERRNIVQMDDVAIFARIANRPRRVIHVLEVVEDLALDRPLGIFIEPASFHSHR